MPIESLHHIALVSRNPEALAAFYRDVLGLTPHRVPAGSTSRWFMLSGTILMIEAADGTQTVNADEEHAHLHASEPGSEMKIIQKERGSEIKFPYHLRQPGWHALLFRIDSSAAPEWRRRLQDASVLIEAESAYSMYFRDPEHNRIGLSWL